MRLAVVLNVASGSLLGRESAAEEVETALRALGHDYRMFLDGPLMERMEQALAWRPDRLVVGGGDGSIAAAATAIHGWRSHGEGPVPPLAILPLGTMNMVANDLKLPLELPAAVAVAAGGQEKAIDLGEVNGRLFLCNAVLGLPARVAQHRETRRGRLGFLAWAGIARRTILSILREPALGVAIRLPAGWRRMRTRAVMVANNRYDDAVGRPFTRTSLDGGVLTLYIARGVGVWSLLHTAIDSLVWGLARAHWLETHELRQVAITAHRAAVRMMVDGEVRLMKPPLRFRIRPRALTVIVPAEETASAAPAGPGGVEVAA
ncbi:diacylglycerol/lipid kinase family protein [Segnochrobactrum spirostomi]|nr:diacylglycerol kinase family protein [Segnochrobactrum spirostomi]